MEHISPHKCIRHAYTDTTVLTAHQPNTAGVPDHWKEFYGPTRSLVGQQKGGRKRRATGTGPALGGEEAEAGKGFLHLSAASLQLPSAPQATD